MKMGGYCFPTIRISWLKTSSYQLRQQLWSVGVQIHMPEHLAPLLCLLKAPHLSRRQLYVDGPRIGSVRHLDGIGVYMIRGRLTINARAGEVGWSGNC